MDGGRLGHAESLSHRLVDERLEILAKRGHRLPVLGSREVDLPQPRRRHDLQAEVSDLAGDGEGALPRLDRTILVARQAEVVGQIRDDPSQPLSVWERGGQRLRLVEALEDGPELAERLESVAEVEPKIDGLLTQLPTWGQMFDGAERLVEPHHGFPIGRAG